MKMRDKGRGTRDEGRPAHFSCPSIPPSLHPCSPGFSLVEVVVASAIALTVVLGVVAAFTVALKTVRDHVERVQAAYLAEEGLEAARIVRDNGWTANIASLTVGANYYLTFDSASSTWKTTTTNAFVNNKFARAMLLENVYRNASKDIVANGTLDSAIKKVTVTVSWMSGNSTTSRSLSTYLTNIFNN